MNKRDKFTYDILTSELNFRTISKPISVALAILFRIAAALNLFPNTAISSSSFLASAMVGSFLFVITILMFVYRIK